MAQELNDNAKAEIIYLDLYSLIQPVKEAQIARYGRHSTTNDYENKLVALKEGKPQRRLQEDRLAREIVRAILTMGWWAIFEGGDSKFTLSNKMLDVIVFPKIPNKELEEKLWALTINDGLLDMICNYSIKRNCWCFESEIVLKGIEDIEFLPNISLRGALRTMLKPFGAEKPLYIRKTRPPLGY